MTPQTGILCKIYDDAFQFSSNVCEDCHFLLLLNVSFVGPLSPKRGLRQGDLMYHLFILRMEYNSRIMCYIGQLRDFSFHRMCSTLKLNHLSFADDLLVFCRVLEASYGWLKPVLDYSSCYLHHWPSSIWSIDKDQSSLNLRLCMIKDCCVLQQCRGNTIS